MGLGFEPEGDKQLGRRLAQDRRGVKIPNERLCLKLFRRVGCCLAMGKLGIRHRFW